MIAGFFLAMFAGHIYVIGIVTAIQIVSFKEVIAIANVPSRAKNLPFTRSLNWYFLGTTMYFLYGESVIYYFKHIVLVDRVLLPFATHHRFISFMLYVIGPSPADPSEDRSFGVLMKDRLCLLRRFAPKGPLPFSIHPVRMDPHGPLPHQRPGAFRYEQHLRRHDLVLPPRLPRHHQRHLCLHLRNHLRPHPADQIIAQENGRRFRRRMDPDHHLRLRHDQRPDALQLLHLPGQCESSLLYSTRRLLFPSVFLIPDPPY